jgi:hypothetical protein
MNNGPPALEPRRRASAADAVGVKPDAAGVHAKAARWAGGRRAVAGDEQRRSCSLQPPGMAYAG